MPYAYASQTTIVAVEGERVRIYEGEVWDADDPVVRAHPGCFTAEPTKLRRTRPPEPPVETATAAPGEKRTAGRKGRTSAS